MAYYETIFILDSLLAPEEIETIIGRVKQQIEDQDAKILNIDKWGKRRLAYEIQKKQYGFYVSIEFEGKGQIPKILENDYNYNDKVLRYLTYRFDKKKLKQWEKDKLSSKAEEPEPEQEVTNQNEEVKDNV
jgi:small subunit ribosomal protein S6